MYRPRPESLFPPQQTAQFRWPNVFPLLVCLTAVCLAAGCSAPASPLKEGESEITLPAVRMHNVPELVQLGYAGYETKYKQLNSGYRSKDAPAIAGKVFQRSVLLHPKSTARPAWVTVPLARRYKRFTAYFGVEDRGGSQGSVRGKVLVDGESVCETSVLRGGEPAVFFDINVRNRYKLQIVVDDGGDGISFDHGLVADAMLYPVEEDVVAFTTPAYRVGGGVLAFSPGGPLADVPSRVMVRQGPDPDFLAPAWSGWNRLTLPLQLDPAAFAQFKIVPETPIVDLPVRVPVQLRCAVAAAAPSQGPPKKKPNVLLIGIDTMRADRMSCYGYDILNTPRMDALAAESCVFWNTYSQMSTTRPSFSGILTGHHPFDIPYIGREKLPYIGNNVRWTEHVRGLGTILGEQGYFTGGFISATPLKGDKTHFARQFDVFDQTFDGFKRLATEVTPYVLDFLEQAVGQDKPFFAFVHYYDPHQPYQTPEDLLEKVNDVRAGALYKKGLYDGEVYFTDFYIGQVLDKLEALGLAENTVIIVVGDHGETLEEHEMAFEHNDVYDTCMRVPLMIRFPDSIPCPTRTVWEPTRLMDILPTLLEALDVEWNPMENRRHGASLWPWMQGQTTETWPVSEVFSFKHVKRKDINVRDYCVRTRTLKLYKRLDGYRLFPVEYQQAEKVDVQARFPKAAANLRTLLDQFFSEDRLTGKDASEVPKLDAETVEGLKALGYM